MWNLAGIERILTCKMNYIANKTDHQVYLTTYEQQQHALAFQVNDNITYQPIDTPIPQRRNYSFLKWIKLYHNSRKLFKKQFIKLLGTIHPDIVIYTVYSYEIMDIIINTCQNMNIKTIMESHIKGETVSMAKYQNNPFLFKLFTLWDWHILKSLKKCNCVVTLTMEDLPYWEQYTKTTKVIPNMITISPIRVKNYDNKRVIAAGRYTHQKGYDMLLEAWHSLYDKNGDWHLYVFGNEDRTMYQEIVNKYKMNSTVHLLPATVNIVEEFSISSIYVMSSRFEGFPLVLVEAMSCGLPCVSFDCPYGPREIISDGEDGFLVKNGDIKELSTQIQLLMSNADLRKSMGEKAIRNIARYNPKCIMEQWDILFKNI